MPARLAHPLIALAVALAVLPAVSLALGFTWGIATEIAILALAATGFNLLLGYTGLLSFGHGLFFGLAAYGTALAQLHWFPGSLAGPVAVGLGLATVAGAATGFLSLRRRGVYFSLLTLAFTALAFYVVYRWTDFTGGENGLSGVQRTAPLGLDFDNERIWYTTVALVCLGGTALLWRIVNSPLGSVFRAIRDHETRTRFIGYAVMRYKLAAFVLSAVFVGLAGTLMVIHKRFVSADLVHVNFSGEILAMTIFGGTGRFLGPALGALVYVALREWLSGYTSAWQFWFGLAFMGFILFSPDGLAGLGSRIAGMLRRSGGTGAMGARIQPDPGAAVPAFLTQPAAAAGPLLEVRGVSKHFGGFRAVNQVDLTVRDRCLHALIGPNGAGKTTLFNLVSGMYAPEGGHVRLGDRELGGLRADQVAGAGVARSFQITSLFQSLTVWENLRLACQARDPGRARWFARADTLANVNDETRALVRFLGLEGLEAVPVSSLSYGGQRLVEIGLALACRPRLLLLDEPLVGLAAAERERVAGLIRRLSGELGVLLVEHDIDRVFALSDTVTAMNEGAVLCEGTPDAVRSHPELQRVYLGDAASPSPPRAERDGTRPAVLRLENVEAGYGKTVILRDVSFEVAEGEVVALLGRNGAGKSTALKAILGLLPVSAGKVTLGNDVVSGRPAEAIARLGIGLVPQGRRLFGGMTVDENLTLGALGRARGPGARWTRERVFERFPRVAQRLKTHADQLSGGEQQMVAIARALLGNVRVLLMDEPFEGLSPAMVDEVKAAVAALRGDIAIVIVEHHLDIVLALADRAVVLDRGQVLHNGPAAVLREDRELRRRVLWV